MNTDRDYPDTPTPGNLMNYIAPPGLVQALLAVGRASRDWIRWERAEPTHYRIVFSEHVPALMKRTTSQASDWLGMLAMQRWLSAGPKIFRPTLDQCRAMEHVDVNLTLAEYTQPYPALYVDMPLDFAPPFCGVLMYNETGEMMVANVMSRGHLDDICTTVGNQDGLIEESLEKYDADCQDVAAQCARVLRVACNSCLALCQWEHRLDHLLPKEVARDRVYAAENSPRSAAAKQRLKVALKVATFTQEVRLHATGPRGEPGEPTGAAKSAHWRRGHWAMQAHGPARTLRKRIYRAPVLVRADLFGGETSATTTTYRG